MGVGREGEGEGRRAGLFSESSALELVNEELKVRLESEGHFNTLWKGVGGGERGGVQVYSVRVLHWD